MTGCTCTDKVTPRPRIRKYVLFSLKTIRHGHLRNLTPETPQSTLSIVVMAKRPAPGVVKTRLIGPLTPQQAALTHCALRDATLNRLTRWANSQNQRPTLILAETGPPVQDVQAFPEPSIAQAWQRVEQGEGDLGQRIENVWRDIGRGPTVFFGIDSPDVPCAALDAVIAAMADADAVLGPTRDGGYWCLAAGQPQPPLLRRIDWGSEQVYDQTHAAGRNAGLRTADAPMWHDVDDADDLAQLIARLNDPSFTADEPALMELRDRLQTICLPHI